MKVTLVYPGIAGYGFKSVGKGMEAGWISHGLAHLSSAAKAQGFDVDLIDLRACSGWEQYRAEIVRRRPDVIGVTMMSVDYGPAMQCVDLAHEIESRIVTVVGGPHPTLALDEVAANPNIDYIITGEGEITFPWLLAAVQTGKLPAERVLPGVPPDLDDLPFPDRELFLDEWRKAGYASDSPEDPFVPELPPPLSPSLPGGAASTIAAFVSLPSDGFLGGECGVVHRATLWPSSRFCASDTSLPVSCFTMIR